MVLENSLFVNGLGNNLISVNMLTKAGYKVTMEDDIACILSIKDLLGNRSIIYKIQKAFNSDQLYHIPFITSTEASNIGK